MTNGKKSKKQSKRFTLHHKHKVEQKVRTHHKKLRRDKKRHPEKFSKRKDPGVPNSLPFKAEIVNEARENHEKELDYTKKRQKELKLRGKDEKANTINMGQTIGDMIKDAEKRAHEFEEKENIEVRVKTVLHDRSAKAYYREFRKVVENADVLLEVLDSRDPQGTRCTPMEEFITNQPGKKLVFILNKADLVPKDNLEAWLKCLRKEKPAVAFKASTQNQQTNLSHSKVSISKGDLSISRCIGADVLMQLLKNYCRSEKIKTAISVGVIGLPNVGKSSLINSLKRSRACNVGATPGITKAFQEIQLDSKIRLLDCPGVILPGANIDDFTSCLRNAVKVEDIEDYYGPVDAILKKAGSQQMMLHYNLPEFKDTAEFLALMAKKSGKLRKGGVSDVAAAARKILHDWNSGRIKYYTRPPEGTEEKVNSALVSELGEEFNLDGFMEKENKFMDSLAGPKPANLICVDSVGPMMEIDDGEKQSVPIENGSDGMETDEDLEDTKKNESNTMLSENVEVDVSVPDAPVEPPVEKKNRWETKPKEVDLSTVNLRKLLNSGQKKMRKEKRRNLKKTDALVMAINQTL